MTLSTPIIPARPTFTKVEESHELDLKAICVFSAIGFFLDGDTYWKDQNVLAPASLHTFDDSGKLLKSDPYFRWKNEPRSISFDQALEEFAVLFETIVKEQTQDKQVILPLSGGLDSRTQAIALKRLGIDVNAYSYQFKNGYRETRIAEQIASLYDFDFKGYEIQPGYLWDHIDLIYSINKGYSEFTGPRQMGVFEELKSYEGVFSLGHWGDVLFDDMGVREGLPFADQVDVVIKKISKQGGLELSQKLWKAWGFQGTFFDYLHSRIEGILKKISISKSANARIRAFKSTQWAPRWTSVNLSFFEAMNPITLPYYDNRMCEFVCSIPESYLRGRKLQIEYIKRHAPELAKLTWDFYHPFNLYTYKRYRTIRGLPERAINSIRYQFKKRLGYNLIQRNWELQLVGDNNQTELERFLFDPLFLEWIPKPLIEEFYGKFLHEDAVAFSHPISMLLTFSVSNKHKFIL